MTHSKKRGIKIFSVTAGTWCHLNVAARVSKLSFKEVFKWLRMILPKYLLQWKLWDVKIY
jgi:hypothetical protein